jgi:hypothetical protein
MDDQRIKQAVLAALEQSLDASILARSMGDVVGRTEANAARAQGPVTSAPAARPDHGATSKVLERIVLGDILDEGILAARPEDRTFPLRLLFSELGSLMTADAGERLAETGNLPTLEQRTHVAEQAFALASGLNFLFRASMDAEAKVRLAVEVSRQFYAVVRDAQRLGAMDAELVQKAAPLLAAIMSHELDRVRLESVDHVRLFDSQLHERTADADPTSSRILRPATFLCRLTTNNAVKAKAQVVT